MRWLVVLCGVSCLALCVGGAPSIDGRNNEDKRIYTFAFGKDWKPYEFINAKGELEGFSLDITRRVCMLAGKHCAYTVYDEYDMCWDAKKMYSKGLNHGLWDVCVGWMSTTERLLKYDFFGDFAHAPTVSLYAKNESTILLFRPKSHRIGFRQSIGTDGNCLKLFENLKIKYPRYYSNWTRLMDGLDNRQIDIALLSDLSANEHGGLRRISPHWQCASKGPSMMLRKNIAASYAWFEPVLKQVLTSPYYRWICNFARKHYGGDPNCFTHTPGSQN